MTPTVALARLRLMSQADADPIISTTDLEVILGIYAVADLDGLGPLEPAWLGAYDLTSAARMVWLAKAGRVVSDVTYDVDGAKYNTSDMHMHCLAMADRMTSTGSIGIGSF